MVSQKKRRGNIMITDCLATCGKKIKVDDFGIIERHLNKTGHSECHMSNQLFSVQSKPQKEPCPKCGDPAVYLSSDRRFLVHYDPATLERCVLSDHSVKLECPDNQTTSLTPLNSSIYTSMGFTPGRFDRR